MWNLWNYSGKSSICLTTILYHLPIIFSNNIEVFNGLCRILPKVGKRECLSFKHCASIFEVKWSESRSVVSDSLWPHGLYSPWNSPGQNTGVGSLSILQGIFPSRGLNPHLAHWRLILYKLSHHPCFQFGALIIHCMLPVCLHTSPPRMLVTKWEPIHLFSMWGSWSMEILLGHSSTV